MQEIGIGKPISNEQLLELDVDVIVPSAVENVINEKNMKNIKSKIILELANGPVTPEADDYLEERSYVILPDILANAGGVVVSYFEWVQNLSNHYWSEEDVNKKLEEYMVNAFNAIIAQMSVDGCPNCFRKTAYVLAVMRILEAEADRGNLVRKNGK